MILVRCQERLIITQRCRALTRRHTLHEATMQSTIHSSVCTSPATALQPLTHALAYPRGSQNSTSRKEKILHYIYVTRARFLRLLAVIKSTNVSAQALQCKVGAGALPPHLLPNCAHFRPSSHPAT
jgi:hypothetical protein